MFICIPILMTTLGLIHAGNGIMNQKVETVFTAFPTNIVFAIMVLVTLISTLDSTLSAAASYVWNEFDLKDHNGKLISVLSMIGLLIFCNIIIYFEIPLVNLFLMGSVFRCLTAPAIIMMIYDKFHIERLFKLMLFALLVLAPTFVYLKLNNYNIACIVPISTILFVFCGYSSKKEVI